MIQVLQVLPGYKQVLMYAACSVLTFLRLYIK